MSQDLLKPTFVFGKLPITGDVIRIDAKDWGYTPTEFGKLSDARIDALNARMGVTRAEREAFEQCSIFKAWENYDKCLENMQTIWPDKKES